jgi:hypothetical protein
VRKDKGVGVGAVHALEKPPEVEQPDTLNGRVYPSERIGKGIASSLIRGYPAYQVSYHNPPRLSNLQAGLVELVVTAILWTIA